MIEPNQTAATIEYFKFRYPELAGRGDGLINIVLSETFADLADPAWTEPGKSRAWFALAAHILSTQGSASVTRGEMIRRKVGDVETEYSGASKLATGYASTPYGSEYLAYMRALFPAVLIV